MTRRKTKISFLIRIILFFILLVLTYIVHILITHPEAISSSSFMSFLSSADDAWRLFVEAVFIVFYGISCVVSCYFISDRYTAELSSAVNQVKLTKDIVTSKELLSTVLFNASSSLIINIVAYTSYIIFDRVIRGYKMSFSSLIEIITCVIIPMIIAFIVSILLFSTYNPNEVEAIDADPEDFGSKLRGDILLKIGSISSVLVAVLSLAEYFLFNYSSFYLVDEGLNIGLSVGEYIAVILRIMFTILGFSLIIGKIINLFLSRISGTSHVIVYLVSLIFKISFLYTGLIQILRVLRIDTTAIITSCSAIGIGGLFVTNDLLKGLSKSISVITKNSLKVGDYVSVIQSSGFLKNFDYSGAWLSIKNQRTFLSYSSMSNLVKLSFPYTCGKVSFLVNASCGQRIVQRIIESSFPKMVQDNSEILLAEPIFYNVTSGFSLVYKFTYLIPSTTDKVEEAEAYFSDCIEKVLIEKNLTAIESSSLEAE